MDIAEKHGGRCLSKEYIDVKTKYEWVCKKGHEFDRTLDSIQSKGSFCTKCPKSKKYSTDSLGLG